jgi:hypothetical protein
MRTVTDDGISFPTADKSVVISLELTARHFSLFELEMHQVLCKRQVLVVLDQDLFGAEEDGVLALLVA